MLSYQHAYHAGNHADVLKHTVLLALLDTLTVKPRPVRFIDTHAGAGGYRLASAAARYNREFDAGIGRLWTATGAPPAVAALLDAVRRYNRDAKLARYPGSPWLAGEALRAIDDLYLFELHPGEHRALVRHAGKDGRVTIRREDGLRGCIGLVPPPARRALVLIDPSYETTGEQAAVVDALQKAHRRFATGIYAVWYPVISRRRVLRLESMLRATGIGPIDAYELCVAPDSPGRGLTGSGMFVVNPPWQLRQTMAIALPWLVEKLGTAAGGRYCAEALVPGEDRAALRPDLAPSLRGGRAQRLE